MYTHSFIGRQGSLFKYEYATIFTLNNNSNIIERRQVMNIILSLSIDDAASVLM